MTNDEKEKILRSWINPEERITVHFLDAPDLNAEVTGCTDASVRLSIETRVSQLCPHLEEYRKAVTEALGPRSV